MKILLNILFGLVLLITFSFRLTHDISAATIVAKEGEACERRANQTGSSVSTYIGCQAGLICQYTEQDPSKPSKGTCIKASCIQSGGQCNSNGANCCSGTCTYTSENNGVKSGFCQATANGECKTDADCSKQNAGSKCTNGKCTACIGNGQESTDKSLKCCDGNSQPYESVDERGCSQGKFRCGKLAANSVCKMDQEPSWCGAVPGSTTVTERPCQDGLTCVKSKDQINHKYTWFCEPPNGPDSNLQITIPIITFPPGDWCGKDGKTCKTAIGDIPTDTTSFINKLFGAILSISGVIAVLIIMLSGYKIMISQGEPQKVEGAKETITAAIIGLLFIIFSLIILQTIGVDILHIPGLGK